MNPRPARMPVAAQVRGLAASTGNDGEHEERRDDPRPVGGGERHARLRRIDSGQEVGAQPERKRGVAGGDEPPAPCSRCLRQPPRGGRRRAGSADCAEGGMVETFEAWVMVPGLDRR